MKCQAASATAQNSFLSVSSLGGAGTRVHVCLIVLVCTCMSVCARVCVCTCVCTCVSVPVYVCTSVCVCTCVSVHVCIFVCTCVLVYKCVHTRLCVRVCVFVCRCICVCVCVCIYVCGDLHLQGLGASSWRSYLPVPLTGGPRELGAVEGT